MKDNTWFEFSSVIPIWYDIEIKDSNLKSDAIKTYEKWLFKQQAQAKFAKIFKDWGEL